MRDYDDLIKDLREYAELVDHDMWDCPYMIADSMKQAADAIEDLIAALTASNEVIAKSRDKWISVEDALPKEERKTYWVYTNDGSQHECRWTNNRFGFGESDKWGWSVFDIPQYTIVTHWMPLPEPPREDKPCQS